MTLRRVGGYDYVQTGEPTTPAAGDTWLDLSVSPPAEKVYDGAAFLKVSVAQLAETNLDAAVSSRSSHADPDPNGRLDANVSSRSSHGDPDPNGYIDAPISNVGGVVFNSEPFNTSEQTISGVDSFGFTKSVTLPTPSQNAILQLPSISGSWGASVQVNGTDGTIQGQGNILIGDGTYSMGSEVNANTTGFGEDSDSIGQSLTISTGGELYLSGGESISLEFTVTGNGYDSDPDWNASLKFDSPPDIIAVY